MYAAYQAHTDLLWPLRTATRLSLPFLQDTHVADTGWLPARQWAAAGQVFELAQITHARPPWRIAEVVAGDEHWPVLEEATLTTPFATLRRCFANLPKEGDLHALFARAFPELR